MTEIDGHVPSNDKKIEQVILGSLICFPQKAAENFPLLKVEHFYDDFNRQIFKCIAHAMADKLMPDMIVLTQIAKKYKVSVTPYEISQMTQYAFPGDIDYHIRILHQFFINRKIEEIGISAIKMSRDNGVDTLDKISAIQTSMQALTQLFYNRDAKSMKDIVGSALKQIGDIMATGIQASLLTPFYDLNAKITGLKKGALYILGARPAMGKTAIAVQIGKDLAFSQKKRVLIFSLEMSDNQLINRIMSSDTKINGTRVESGDLLDSEFAQISNISSGYTDNMIIDSSAENTIEQMRAKSLKIHQKEPIDLIIVDYLQLMKSKGGPKDKSRENEVSEISRGLKLLAKELNIPVLALSQLSRKVEERTDKRPNLSDLRESGSIEADADVVFFLFRPEYYGITEDESGNNLNGLAEIIIAKNRTGPIGRVLLRFEPSYSLFLNYAANTSPGLL